jgi:hypothetical protein
VKIDGRALIAPLIAVVVLLVMLQLTLGALRTSGAWRVPTRAARPASDPFAPLDALLAHTDGPPDDGVARNPFALGARDPGPRFPGIRPRPRPPAPPPMPLLTSIVWDADPRATIRYDGHDFSVRESSLFADFTVKSISRTEVVLERGGQPLVLTLRSKGGTQ